MNVTTVPQPPLSPSIPLPSIGGLGAEDGKPMGPLPQEGEYEFVCGVLATSAKRMALLTLRTCSRNKRSGHLSCHLDRSSRSTELTTARTAAGATSVSKDLVASAATDVLTTCNSQL